MYVRPTAPLPIGGVVDDAIKLYRESFARCWPIALVGSLIMGTFGIFLTIYVRNAGVTVTGMAFTALIQAYSQPPVMALYLLQSVLSLAFYGALIASLNAVALGETPLSFGEALAIGFTRLGRAVVSGVVWWVILVVGFLLLLVPGIYFLGALCLWPVALYAEDAGAMQALQYSRDLIKGHWWRSSTILTIAAVIILVFSVVVGLIAGVFAAISRHDLATAQLIIQVISIAANVFVLPMIPAVLLVMYRDLQLRREGGDLAARVGALP
jgi:hypothetical protein